MSELIHAAFEGGAALAKALEALPEAVGRSVMVEALKAGAAPMKDRMEMNAPLDLTAHHPHLAENIGVSVTRDVNGEAVDRLTQTAVAVGPTKNFFYGFFDEFGTARQGAQPWARPAFDEGKEEGLDIIGRAAWAAIERKAKAVSPQTP